jgi:hypothetical protein
MSNQLVPDINASRSASIEEEETDLLFSEIARETDASRHGKKWDPAFAYFVLWSPDSQWVAVEGGAHKFWHLLVYHLTDGRFEQVKLPHYSDYTAYFRRHARNLMIRDFGLSEKVKKKGCVEAYTYWLQNGVLAVDAYPYLLREPEFEEEFFFRLDCRKTPAAILGCGQ